MEENINLVFHGFLNLTNLEKLKMVEKINEYFDANDREPLRKAADEAFAKINFDEKDKICQCCGR